MLKIKDHLIQQLYRSDLSDNEQLFFMELIKRCDESGLVKGVNYKTFIKEIGCCKSLFYVMLDKLTTEGFIYYTRSLECRTDRDIKIIGNDFSEEKVYSNYTKLNINLFNTEEYKNMGAGCRRVIFYLIFKAMKQSFVPGKKDTKNRYRGRIKRKRYEEMAKEIGITKRMLVKYCKSLSEQKIISIGHSISINQNSYDIITPAERIIDTLKETITEKGQEKNIKVSDRFFTNLHFVETICRRKKIATDKQNLRDTAVLIQQYSKRASDVGKDINELINTALKHIEDTVLESRFVHKLIRNLIDRNYDNSIIVYN